MSELLTKLRSEFQDEEYRHAYAEECLNTMIASQIKVLREQREMTQSSLADKTGMKQPRLSILEDANYSNWSINTLKRFARAFDVALTVSFDSFSNLVMDFEALSRETLSRPSFKDDPLFKSDKIRTSRKFRRRQQWTPEMKAALHGQASLFETPKVIAFQSMDAASKNTVQTPPVLPEMAGVQKGDVSHANSISAAG